MPLTKVASIPSGLIMIERAEVYVGADGTEYVVFRPSKGGIDQGYTAFQSDTPIFLDAVEDAPSRPQS